MNINAVGPFGAKPKADLQQIAMIKRWVAARFELDDQVPVMVTELRCTEEGCPPLETVIAILDVPGQPRQHKLHKAMAEIIVDDIVALPNDAHTNIAETHG
jgi:hypothetical protein